jgi:hypothetical protein
MGERLQCDWAHIKNRPHHAGKRAFECTDPSSALILQLALRGLTFAGDDGLLLSSTLKQEM